MPAGAAKPLLETTADPASRSCAALRHFFSRLAGLGVRDLCLSPGSRSTPLVLAAHATGALRMHVHIDERSAAFFALGLARAAERPVALLCTSGTAAANFTPAVVEAWHSHVPLLVLTADRPVEVRGWGAPQAIDQVRLYGGFTRWFAEVPADRHEPRLLASLARRAVAVATGWPGGPIHLNFPVREPLVPRHWPLRSDPGAAKGETGAPEDATGRERRFEQANPPPPGPATVARLAARVRAVRSGMIACGPLFATPELAAAVTALAGVTGFPVFADPLSGLRDGPHARDAVLVAGDAILRDRHLAACLRPELVLRIGPVPVSRAFSEWVSRHEPEVVVVDPRAQWPDPQHCAAEVVQADPAALCRELRRAVRAAGGGAGREWAAGWLRADRAATGALRRWLSALEEPFEGRVLGILQEILPEDAVLCAGNSMPVRDLDTFWAGRDRRIRFIANRGANGIDGFVSTVLGVAAAGFHRVVAVAGDLTLLHDVGGFAAARQSGRGALFVVIENDGGGIFSYLPHADLDDVFERYFATPHGIDPGPLVRAFGGRFERVAGGGDLEAALRRGCEGDGLRVVGVPIARARSAELHREAWAVAAAAAREALEGGAA